MQLLKSLVQVISHFEIFWLIFVCTDPDNTHEVIFWDNLFKLRPWLM